MKKRYLIPLILIGLILLLSLWFYQRVIYDKPELPYSEINPEMLEKITDNHFRLGDSWLRKNADGNWECYLEGDAYDRGRTIGILQGHLLRKQEEVFVAEIEKHVPNNFMILALKIGVSWFNRNLDQYLPLEFRQEIYGVSEFFSDEYDYVGPKFNRIVNYHAAHDIGHAVQNMRLVGCTVLGEWEFDADKNRMIVGRNFDFYFGDEFAKEKVVMLMNPDEGHRFLSVTWGGFCGVVSGMNEMGLGITLNADKSDIPRRSGTPVSIIAREILQYASTIEEAMKIARSRQSFVSESFTISSAIDQKVAVIEKTPDNIDLYIPNEESIVVTNHFQSPALKNLEINLEHIQESESQERYNRTEELLDEKGDLDYLEMVEILRDQKGFNGKNIGLGNPQAINQLLAHHAVIFENTQNQVWVSTSPYQLGIFNAYDLDEFNKWEKEDLKFPISIDSLRIEPDSFLVTASYEEYESFKKLDLLIKENTSNSTVVDHSILEKYRKTNSNYYGTYMVLGDYYKSQDDAESAINYYQSALDKEIAYETDSIYIITMLEEFESWR